MMILLILLAYCIKINNSCSTCYSATDPGCYCKSSSNEVLCPLGSFCVGGAAVQIASPTSCSSGTYSDITGANICKSCLPGTASSAVGANSVSTCVPCLIGFFASNYSSGACTKCPNSMTTLATASLSSTSCFPSGANLRCIDGSMSTSSANCAQQAIVTQNLCQPGYVTMATGQCVRCPIGYYSSIIGSYFCTPCQPGTFSSNPGSTTCTSCASNTFTNLLASSFCLSCPPNSFTSGINATYCSPLLNQAYCADKTSYLMWAGSIQECYFSATSFGPMSLCHNPLPTEYVVSPCTLNSDTVVSSCGISTPGKYISSPCLSGAYSSLGMNSIISNCAEGYYTSSSNTANCLFCSAGFFSKSGATYCTQCAEGTFQPLPGQGNCTVCPDATISTVGGVSCFGCSAGYSCKGGLQTPCVAGTYSSGSQSSCTQCPIGFYCPFSSSSPYPCSDGYTSLANSISSSDCTMCQAGYYCLGGRTQICPFNTFSSTGASFCNACKQGYSCLRNGTEIECSAGTYNNGAFSTCQFCPNNTFSASGAGYCSLCPSGYKCSSNEAPIPCGLGTYSDPSVGSCVRCPSGTICGIGTAIPTPCTGTLYSTEGSSSCSSCPDSKQCLNGHVYDCPAGNYCLNGILSPCQIGSYNDGSFAKCQECELGFFNSKSAATSKSDCKECQVGFTTLSTGSGYASDCLCAIGFYINPLLNSSTSSNNNCLSCPTSMVCLSYNLSIANVNATTGNYLVGDNNKPSLWNQIGTLPCPLNACVNNTCNIAQGYSGFLCSKCSSGFFKSGSIQSSTQCVPCNPPVFLYIEIIFTFFISFLILGYTIFNKLRKSQKLDDANVLITIGGEGDGSNFSQGSNSKSSIIVKLAVSHLQVLGIVGRFEFSWPTIVSSLFSFSDSAGSLNFVSNGGFKFRSLGGATKCLMTFGGYSPPVPMQALLINLVILLFNFLSVVVFWIIFCNLIAKEEFKQLQQRLILSVIALFYLMYSTFSTGFFETLSCHSYSPDQTIRLDGSLDTECWSSNHWSWIYSLSLPVFFIIIFGLPLITFGHLYRRYQIIVPSERKGIVIRALQSKECQFTFGFLFESFQIDFWYWELIVLLRKLLLSVVCVFLASPSSSSNSKSAQYAQGLSAIFILSVSLILQTHFNPYVSHAINSLEQMGLAVSTLTLYLGLWTFYLSDQVNNYGYLRSFITFTILLLNIGWLTYALLIIFMDSYTVIRVYIIKCFARRKDSISKSAKIEELVDRKDVELSLRNLPEGNIINREVLVLNPLEMFKKKTNK